MPFTLSEKPPVFPPISLVVYTDISREELSSKFCANPKRLVRLLPDTGRIDAIIFLGAAVERWKGFSFFGAEYSPLITPKGT
jgi:hypothetical protein